MTDHWLDRLAALLARFPEYGMGGDVAGMCMADRWGAYRFLKGLADLGERKVPTRTVRCRSLQRGPHQWNQRHG